MASGKQQYRRLQVRNVWHRTAFEIVAIIFAIVFCCVTIVSAYEKTYSEAAASSAKDSALQLAHSISHLVTRDAVEMEDKERRDYVAGVYAEQLDSCFIREDEMYSGAVYVLTDSQPAIYAAAGRYAEVLEAFAAAEDGNARLEQAVRDAFTGIESVVAEGDVCIAFVPGTDDSDVMPYSVTAVSVFNRDSFDYNSTVRGRVIVISMVVGALIVGYYLVSAYITEKNRVKEKAVNEL